MSKERTFGIIDSILGIFGVFRGIFVMALSIWGLTKVSGSAFKMTKIFFGLALTDGILIGLIFGAVLLTSGIMLIRGKNVGRYLAVSYGGARLLFGMLSLAAVILFFAKGAGECSKAAKMENGASVTISSGTESFSFGMTEDGSDAVVGAKSVKAVKGVAWTVQILVLLGAFFGFFLAIVQFVLLMKQEGGYSSGTRSGGYYPSGTDPTTQVETADKTQVFKSASKTVTLQLIQNGKPKETKQFTLYDQAGQAKQFVIGRDAACNMAISNDKAVTGRHCSLRCDSSGQVCLTDLDSSNGTLLKRGIADPRKIEGKTPVLHDDIILLGYKGMSQVRVIYDWSVKRVTAFN